MESAANIRISLADKAYDFLSRSLHNGQLRPGELVECRKVAASIGSSSAPVWEAIKRLEHEGLLQTLPRRGTRVSVPNIEDVRGQLLVREALECQAATMYSGSPIRAGRDALLELARRADGIGQDRYVRLQDDLIFHTALVELADCDALVNQFRRVATLWLFYEMALATVFPEMPVDLHVNLLEDLCHADADAASLRIRTHIRSGKERIYRSAGSSSQRTGQASEAP